MNNILKAVLGIILNIQYYFWLCYFFTISLPILIPLLIEREYLYIKIMINEVFNNEN